MNNIIDILNNIWTTWDCRISGEQQMWSTIISRMVRQHAASWSKGLQDKSTVFAAEATAITLALDYYWHMDPVQHDVIVYSDLMPCLQSIQ